MTLEQKRFHAIMTGLALAAIATRQQTVKTANKKELRPECADEAEAIATHAANLWPEEEV
jgi:hypothetical protein